MNKQQVAKVVVLTSALLLAGCAYSENEVGEIPPVLERTLRNGLDDAKIRDWRRLYAETKSESGRRALFLRAIEEGFIRPGTSVFTVDQIFDTHFDSDFYVGDTIRTGSIYFADQPPTSHGPSTVANRRVGWYADFDYDSGIVQSYYLSNLHKGLSYRMEGRAQGSVEDLTRLYAAAKSELERRDVCLQAIDEGVVGTSGPVHVSTVDAIFGTSMASELPSRKRHSRIAVVHFSDHGSKALGAAEKIATSSDNGERNGWFLSVEYYYDGNIAAYYLTNLPGRTK